MRQFVLKVLFQFCYFFLLVAWGALSGSLGNAQALSGGINRDSSGSCEYEETSDGICGWLTPSERREKYQALMGSAYQRLIALIKETQSRDSEASTVTYDRVISGLAYVQKNWVLYNGAECFFAGDLGYGAVEAATLCEIEGILMRFLKLNRAIACLESKSVEDRYQQMSSCFAALLPLIQGDGRGF